MDLSLQNILIYTTVIAATEWLLHRNFKKKQASLKKACGQNCGCAAKLGS